MKDMMPHFDLYQPDSLDNALDLRGVSAATDGCWPAARTATTG